MSTEEIIKEYKEKICPRCEHYIDKDYNECNIAININQEANCINYKCASFCKKTNVTKNKLKREKFNG